MGERGQQTDDRGLKLCVQQQKGSLPTRGAAHAATAPSKDRSKAYTVERRCSGTMSANIALLLLPHLQPAAQQDPDHLWSAYRTLGNHSSDCISGTIVDTAIVIAIVNMQWFVADGLSRDQHNRLHIMQLQQSLEASKLQQASCTVQPKHYPSKAITHRQQRSIPSGMSAYAHQLMQEPNRNMTRA